MILQHPIQAPDLSSIKFALNLLLYPYYSILALEEVGYMRVHDLTLLHPAPPPPREEEAEQAEATRASQEQQRTEANRPEETETDKNPESGTATEPDKGYRVDEYA